MPKAEDAQVLKALGDMTRLRILGSLNEKPNYISALAAELDLDRTTVAYHLALLQSAGLLESHYEILEEPKSKGKAAHVYSVNMHRLREVLALPTMRIIRENVR